MSLGRVRKGVSRLYREMFVSEMGPFFYDSPSLPQCYTPVCLQSQPVSRKHT